MAEKKEKTGTPCLPNVDSVMSKIYDNMFIWHNLPEGLTGRQVEEIFCFDRQGKIPERVIKSIIDGSEKTNKKVVKECNRKLDVGRNEIYKSLFMAYVYPETSTLKVITTARRQYELCEGEWMYYLISFTKSGKICWIKANYSIDKLENLIAKYSAN